MSTVSPTSMAPSNSATLEGAAITVESPSSRSLPLRSEFITTEGLRYTVKRVIDV